MATKFSYVKIMNEREVFSPQKEIGKFTIQRMIGQGGFGDIYGVKDNDTSQMFAMKCEMNLNRTTGLAHEIRILKSLQGSPMFPRIISIGENEKCKYFVMELLGPSISKIRRRNIDQKFPLDIALRIAIEMLRCIRQLHRRGFIHRDIKPGNFLVRPDLVYPICLIDFGLAKSYVDIETGAHLDRMEDCGFVGTSKYASANALRGISLSRRDDLFSWFYSLIELVNGHVPWPDNITDREKCAKIRKAQLSKSVFQTLSSHFSAIYRKISKLKYDETPDYQAIENILEKMVKETKTNINTPLVSQLLSENQIKKIMSFGKERKNSIGNMYETLYSIPSLPKFYDDEPSGCTACSIA
ncbi:Casein kinase I [Tritrichomonas foetus]|uniref:non-specific serine/threonine protein kinase n=1 Tax=Tritrichomonas foetus TaxID=1144522 RepID=A0A1J4KZ74_9EUKA|nr:Casein kinase I [Tritrichomonas foetus]|eukprot:OHT16458.1 Casein kinase I [Tritrichomonas foetus]